MEDRFQDEGWIVQVVGYAVQFIKRTEHLYEADESSIQSLYW